MSGHIPLYDEPTFQKLPDGCLGIAGIDIVNHPPHYNKGKVECIDALEAATADLTGIEAVCTANAIKYLWRWKAKGGKEDLKKAQWYINKLMETTK